MAGVERLGGNQTTKFTSATKSPVVAALLGLIPGLGAVYNGLVVMALVQFAVTVGLWQLDDIFDASLFWWAGTAAYVYSIYTAYQTALRLNAGEDLSGEENKLKNILQEKTKVWGSALIVLGGLSILHWILPHSFVSHLWTLILIGVGTYFVALFRRVPKAKITQELPQNFQPETPPVIAFDPLARDYSQAETRRFDVR